MLTETEKQHNDLIDIVIEACREIREVETPEGKTQKQLLLDPEKVYWKTQIVSSPTFARFVYELKEFEHMATQCYNNMSLKRAGTMAKQIQDLVSSFKYSIDAKSSESLRDPNNTSSTLIDKINKNKIEKAYTIKGEAKKSLWEGIVGREGQKEADED